MANEKLIQWVLRIGVAGEFLGHSVFALQGKAAWIGWISKLTGADAVLAAKLLVLVGISDLVVAAVVLFKPVRIVLMWAVIWGFWTALLRPVVGELVWDFIERWANWAAPLALLLLSGGFPKSFKEWFGWGKNADVEEIK